MEGGVTLRLDKILHLEDEPQLLHLMKLYFNDWGGEGQRGWFQASRLEDGLKIIQDQGNSFQMMIVDLNLEDSWGIATLEAIRPCTVSPFVVCTGGDTLEIEHRAKEFGIYGIVDKGKSFTRDRIRPVIRDAYMTWRDERLVLPLQAVADELKAATERRTKKLQDYGLRG